MSAEWYVMKSGDRAGQPHMTGWKMSAIKGEATGVGDDGWLSYGICPRCRALVLTDDQHAYGDQQWEHERWHAETDWPIPSDLS